MTEDNLVHLPLVKETKQAPPKPKPKLADHLLTCPCGNKCFVIVRGEQHMAVVCAACTAVKGDVKWG